MRIIYITRTYALDENPSNCSGFRNYTVSLLRKRYEVVVVTPNYGETETIRKSEMVAVPYTFRRHDMWLERIGLYDDYLQRWTDATYKVLENEIRPDDLIMAVSGGEMACIMLASRLKDKCGCKVIVNFHDPVDATNIKGKQTAIKIHVPRDQKLGKYLKSANGIITCNEMYRDILIHRYRETLPCIHYSIHPCIHNVYMGFRGEPEIINRKNKHEIVHIVYAGTMSPTQGAERFIDLFGDRRDIELIFVGNCSDAVKEVARTNNNIKTVAALPHNKYIEYIKDTADVGLVALNGEEYGVCVPSKLFELINLEIPIFGILPDGDAKTMINNGYGYACEGNDKAEANRLLDKLLTDEEYDSIRDKMRADKNDWQMDKLFEKVYRIIDEVVDANNQ